ncbi:hypothetical protein BSKO_04114 [Bryopsis sp. KO-2023]|nr:hypothetical protein BSKO_04114 [Bryopsis sp. KO-2023]
MRAESPDDKGNPSQPPAGCSAGSSTGSATKSIGGSSSSTSKGGKSSSKGGGRGPKDEGSEDGLLLDTEGLFPSSCSGSCSPFVSGSGVLSFSKCPGARLLILSSVLSTCV